LRLGFPQHYSRSMNAPARLLIHGASGRMGRALLRLAAGEARVAIVAAVSTSGASLADFPQVPIIASRAIATAPPFDVAVDFSLAAGFDAVLALCRERRVGLVSGTTGLDPTQQRELDTAAGEIPVLWAANFSLGVAVLENLVRRAAAALPTWDCDLVEAHHTHKRDAPSGTALALGRAIASERGTEPNYASLRSGDIVGEHLVQFAGKGERLELIHRATDRDIFARGALECAVRLRAQAPGRHSIAALLLGSD
jgi:4-hydroxy-tetrahydrodipicolinate reductase